MTDKMTFKICYSSKCVLTKLLDKIHILYCDSFFLYQFKDVYLLIWRKIEETVLNAIVFAYLRMASVDSFDTLSLNFISPETNI